ncbi:aminotransferase class III-fold pyridoxal phosphate-dependent enzyme [Marinomonas spartinae]|uniref:aminotransferase class III-fold pyridoxal phosphate-dependent enzyme n=1 Tax=Marinomonas spartinae TaxID=1792290 RepID=UPI0018F12949|nr:aminotransferase class III-fold pyridoxal phosphate-dependent enzyme [Marinomonas spartinae]MBJ7555485.1 aminotransferase class III-fold pyridoxal phosphate-dependent enzyme [Marinomonas spartinae]
MTNHLSLAKRNPPQFELSQIKSLVRELYGLEGSFTALNSERDLAWLVRNEEGPQGVIKISNAQEPEGIVDLQIKAVEHILEQDPTLVVPPVIPTRQHNAYEWITSELSGERHMIRLIAFMDGRVVENTPEAYCDEYYFNIGATMGRMNAALQSFYHPYAGSNQHLWDLGHCLQLRDMLPGLPEGELRDLLTSTFDKAEHHTLPALKKTRCQLVHQDANDANVMVSHDDPTEIAAVLDFGDVAFNSILAEIVTISETYAEDEEDPIRPLLHVAQGYDSAYPLTGQEVDLLFDVMHLRLAIASLIINYRKLNDPEAGTHLEDRLFTKMLFKLNEMGQETVTRRLRDALRFPVYSPIDNKGPQFSDHQDELVQHREQHLGKIWHFYDQPLHITRAQGGWMYSADGTAYLDAYNNVPQMGHCNPHIVKAIARQAEALNTNTRYMCDIVADYAARLTKDLPDHLDTCIFVNSGSEANDLAIQIAQSLSGHQGGLVLNNAYHGCTELTTKYSPESWLHLPEAQYPTQIECLIEPDMYNGPYANHPDAAALYAADADRAIQALNQRGFQPAALIVDTAMCAHGVITPPDSYFDRIADKAHAAGGYVIADEVQAGLGRMGTFWGFMGAGLNPEKVDFITMGKPVANGHPLGVVILSSKMMKQFIGGTHPLLFSTFGGNTVACAAGMAVLDVIEREKLVQKSNDIGDQLRARLRQLAEKHPLIGDVRGRGMLVGLELVTNRENRTPAAEETEQLINEMIQRQVMIGKSLPGTLKIRPSLTWGKKEVDFFINAMDESLKALG